MANVNKDIQAAFMEAVSSIKEYAKVNGNTVTRDDIHNFSKDMALDESKFQMISGYLMANSIKIEGEAGDDNEFLNMMENAAASKAGGEAEEEEDSGNISEEEKEDKKVADDIVSHLNYEEDEKYLKMYLNDLSGIQPMTDTTRSYLLMNIVEDKDKESLKLLTESYLEKIVGWIEPFRGRGALACDLIQEANLAMTAYIGQQKWLNNYEWKDKIHVLLLRCRQFRSSLGISCCNVYCGRNIYENQAPAHILPCDGIHCYLGILLVRYSYSHGMSDSWLGDVHHPV